MNDFTSKRRGLKKPVKFTSGGELGKRLTNVDIATPATSQPRFASSSAMFTALPMQNAGHSEHQSTGFVNVPLVMDEFINGRTYAPMEAVPLPPAPSSDGQITLYIQYDAIRLVRRTNELFLQILRNNDVLEEQRLFSDFRALGSADTITITSLLGFHRLIISTQV
jgi:hypothetical protein